MSPKIIKLYKVYVGETSMIPMDIVFYKDKDDKLYRLRYLKSRAEDHMTEFTKMGIFMCISKYAPDIIEGECCNFSEQNPYVLETLTSAKTGEIYNFSHQNLEVHVTTERGTYILDVNDAPV